MSKTGVLHYTAGPSQAAKQLTLSQPGGQIMPTTVIQAPPGFSDLATALFSNQFCDLNHEISGF